MNSRYYPVKESEFDLKILPLISSYKNRSGRPPESSHYQAFCGILYILRTGIPWRDLPPCFGNWHTIYMRFKRWSDSGLFWNIIKESHNIKNENIRYIIADKGYDSDAIRDCIEAFGQKPVIPYRKNRKTRKNISGLRYQTRNIIERVFGRIKEFRRVATRYDKLDSRFLSFIACAFIWQLLC